MGARAQKTALEQFSKRVLCKQFANVIENPYYGGEDDVMNTVNASNTNVQRQDPGFASVTVVDNLYYE